MRFSIIMPVLDEAAILEYQLQQLHRQCAHLDYELFIVDGGSSDSTPTIGRGFGSVISAPKGRARQMNAGARQASGDVLLFLHADTSLPPQAFELIQRALQDQSVVAGAFQLRFDNPYVLYKLIALTTNLRSRLLGVFTGDQAYFVRYQSFKACGGYPDQPLMEDLEIIKRLKRLGAVKLLSASITTSARRHQQTGLLKSICFMWYMRLLYAWGVSPARLQQIYKDIR